ncbi:MAG: hypothetical protein Q8K98_11350 [Bacteroidota bacterium]|nr:hypothetical protein [Bacteroidota bacterium]
MNNFLTIITITIFLHIPIYSQSGSDSLANRNTEKETRRSQFVDENANGIDDRTEEKAQKGGRRQEKFIDRDGDGVCDNRSSGIGLRLRHQGDQTTPGKRHRR